MSSEPGERLVVRISDSIVGLLMFRFCFTGCRFMHHTHMIKGLCVIVSQGQPVEMRKVCGEAHLYAPRMRMCH